MPRSLEVIARREARTKERDAADMARFLEHGVRENWEFRETDIVRCRYLRKKYPDFQKKWDERRRRIEKEKFDAKIDQYENETSELVNLHKTAEGRATKRYSELRSKYPREDVWGTEAVHEYHQSIVERDRLKQLLVQAERLVEIRKKKLYERMSDLNEVEFRMMIDDEVFPDHYSFR